MILPTHQAPGRMGEPLRTVQLGDALLTKAQRILRLGPNLLHLRDFDRALGIHAGPRQCPEPSLTVGLLNRFEAQVSSPRVSKRSASTQRLMGL